MEQPEVPIEHVQEHLKHQAHVSNEPWITGVALSTAILAAFAAIASLMAGDNANEAMINQIKAANQWSYYQAKGIKAGQLNTRLLLLHALKEPVSPEDDLKLESYAKEQAGIMKEADLLQTEAEHRLHTHVIFARAVTLFQIAIAVGAISVLTKLRGFWGASLLLGAGGLAFLIQGLLQ